jgi:hypothetical protein
METRRATQPSKPVTREVPLDRRAMDERLAELHSLIYPSPEEQAEKRRLLRLRRERTRTGHA